MTQKPPASITHQPFYVRHREDWAIRNERDSHRQALYLFGEPALFTLLWKVEDHEAGLVDYCIRCRRDPTSIEGRVQAVYRQPLTATCPICYGTTFGEGIRAQIVRPAIFTDADEDQTKTSRGVTHPENLVVESTDDFRSRTGDFVFRKDGTRWQLSHPTRVMVRTGYEQPTQDTTSIGYGRIPASREDESSAAFSIPPSADQLAVILAVEGDIPQDPIYEQINGPLIPPVGE